MTFGFNVPVVVIYFSRKSPLGIIIVRPRDMKKITTILLLLLFAGNLYAFDYQSYKLRDLDEIISESRLYDPEMNTGQSLLIPPHRIHLFEKLVKYPFKCEDAFPIAIMLAMALGRTEDEMPSISTCMVIESKTGEKIGVFIQDSIAQYIEKEYEPGQKIHLWSLWLFVNSSDKKPYFVINGIGDTK
jgi:hypothetical protein